MGLSTLYANVVMFAILLSVLSVLLSVFSDYAGDTTTEVKDQGNYLKDRLDTSVEITSIVTSTSDSFVRVFVVNDGKTTLDVNCTDFYMDRGWVNRADMNELVLLNVTFDPGVWNPDETLKMRTQYPTDDGLPHEAKVVSCNGISDSMIFYGVG